MTTSAIQQDVQQTGTEDDDTGKNKPTQQRKQSAREEAMAAIANSRNADFTQETGIKLEPTQVVNTDPDADPGDAEAEALRKQLEATDGVLPTNTEQQLALQDAPAAPAKRKVKIDGQEVEVTDDEIVREFQKGRTADKRLSDLAEERRRLEADRQALELQRQQLAAQQQAPARVGAVPEVEIDPEVTQEFSAAVQSGDPEQVTQALKKAVSSAVLAARNVTGAQATQSVDPAAIAAQVRQQIAIDSALEQSRKDYPQMYADPDIEQLAATKIERLQSQGKAWTEALTEVSSELATKFGWKANTGRPAAEPANNRREEKLARKEGIDNVGAGPNVKSTNAEPPQQSTSDVIREMARLRGQTV